MNEIKLFSSPIFGEIRTATNENNDPLFCLSDLCKALNLTNATVVAQRLDDEEVTKLDLGGRVGITNFVNESGLYTTILRSDSPEAKPFRKWVTSDVLPAIRKHGMYATDITVSKMISDPDFAIELLTSLKEEKQKRINAENKVSEQAPKALFADAVATSTHSILIGELSKILKQNGIEMGQNRLFDWLRKNGYLCQFGERYNQPTQKAMEMELFDIKKTTINKPDGTILISTTTKVTGKGQIYFVNKFLKLNKN